MSARGEFDRHLGYCIDFLEAADCELAFAWATRLLEVRVLARDDLTLAANRVISYTGADPSIESIPFSSAGEGESFRQVCDPLLQLARVLAGVPADRASSP